jgi:hypothetical protein
MRRDRTRYILRTLLLVVILLVILVLVAKH